METVISEFSCPTLLEAIPDSVVIVDRNGAIVGVNTQTETLFGYSREEILNEQVEILIPTKIKDVHTKYREQFFEDPGRRFMGTRLTLTALRKDGSILPVDISLSPMQGKSDFYIIAAIRDISDMAKAQEETLEGWSRAMDFRDKETEEHTQRVTRMTVQIARKMALSETAITRIRHGALLHDIGKMGVPDGILLKPGKLTEEEWAVMRKHPEYAYEMLWPISFLRPALDIPYCHHEKWDGTGYPRGLKGEDIPLAARIFAVVDVWDALRCDRPYREGWSGARVCEYIKEQSGKHFDPQIVDVFMELFAGSLCQEEKVK
ncbi:MAG: PAS domain S-box protein [Chloroflexi bacterium]|nr:PAS domain S-box protein [Chloroflexota bacterium]